ncbi:MAG: hypothetical protein KF872_06635 [Chitinophagales bacterium]|nr:hypothetical protein [Chitinophagales bacterium]
MVNSLSIQNPSQLFASQKVFSGIELNTPFQQKVKVLVLHQTNEQTTSQDLDLLHKILAAAKLQPNDFTLQNLDTDTLSLQQITAQFQPEVVLIFSNLKYTLGKNLQLPLYETVSLQGIKILRSAPLQMLHTKPEYKKQLWNALQALFNV